MHEEFAYYNEFIRCYRSGKIERFHKPKSGYGKAGTWKEIKPTNFDSSGYLKFQMEKGKTPVKFHKAIWIAFNGDVPNGYHIHHMNGIKTDNRLENLELVDAGKHESEHNKLKWDDGVYDSLKKPVIGINKVTGLILEADSLSSAVKMLGKTRTSNISDCIAGRKKTAYGYRWYYKDDLDLTV